MGDGASMPPPPPRETGPGQASSFERNRSPVFKTTTHVKKNL